MFDIFERSIKPLKKKITKYFQVLSKFMGEIFIKILEATSLIGVDKGNSSPYCSVRLLEISSQTIDAAAFKEVSGTTERTKSLKHTLEPKWNQEFKIKVEDFCYVIYFKVWVFNISFLVQN
jgi:Ca2+-dependent lipid-binding protein